ncbi:MAG: beta-ketoacyl synthase N-terminal-like domain-containing protein [Nevskia sp.]|nr:beta-ketoacyl synthase N-terminal-like domain-containing protein [Nevskia sp.]
MSEALDIAIVGLAGCYAGARDARAFWQNILDKVDAVTDAPADWTGPYFEAEPKTNDRIYTTKGGFLGDLAEVNPLEFGVLPSMAEGGDPDHMMALKHARDALFDAGYAVGRRSAFAGGERSFDPERAGVILGRGTYGNRGLASVLSRGLFLDQAMQMAQTLRPDLSAAELADLRDRFRSQLPVYNADMVGPLTPNVIAGMIANRLNLMGPSYIVDAACASTLMALDAATRELASGRCDLMLTGGVHSHTPPQLYIQFCQIQALSHDRIRPFQRGADGTLLGEGVGMLVLKRLADAERDGDRIYAVIKGIGTSSDGKAKGLLAPRLEGQVLALRRAYAGSGIDPLSVDLIEAHGTGTAVGDRTEMDALQQQFGARGAGPQVAVGSVKSMIGHCLPAAGSASLIKTALALHHKVLPPTLCEEPNPELLDPARPFYINNETRPWVHGKTHPRRAGVNAFGFGGANAHVIMEEYRPARPVQVAMLHAPRPSELVTLAADSPAALADLAQTALSHLRGPAPAGIDEIARASSAAAQGQHRLAIVADDADDLGKKLEQSIDKLRRPDAKPFKTRSGVYYGAGAAPGKTCFLYPGEGAQYPGMLAGLCVDFPQVREWFDFMERTGLDSGMPARAPVLFPAPSGLDAQQRKALEDRLYGVDVAAESVFVASLALQSLFDDLGLEADAMLGHSTGENTAITACGVRRFHSREEIAESVRALNRIFGALEAGGGLAQGTLLTVGALRPEARAQLLAELADGGSGMLLAMDNCPNQVVLFGPPEQAHTLKERLAAEGAICTELPFGRAYHTPLFKPIADAYRDYFRHLDLGAGRAQLYSARSAAPFPQEAAAIGELAAAQWENPVRFTDTVERLYADGYRVFVEVGPSGNLTSFVSDTLRERHDVVVVSSNSRRRSDLLQLHHMLGQLFAAGVPFQPAALYAQRRVPDLDLHAAPRPERKPGIRLKLRMPELHIPADWKPLQRRVRPVEAPPPASAPPPAPAPAIAAVPPTAVADPRLDALRAHFSLMQEFLDSQARVLGALALPAAPVSAPPPAEAPVLAGPSTDYPLLGRVVERGADRLVMERSYEADTDLFLRDHAIGPAPSPRQPELRSLVVMPFTLSMEILAEAACCLAGDALKVTGIENSRGHRWLSVEDGPLRLRIVAERAAPAADTQRVTVRLYQLDGTGPAGGALAFEGLVTLAAGYPEPPPVRPWSGSAAHAARNNPVGELYQHGMFHGPRLQGVKHLRRWADEAIEADMAAIATDDYFSFTERPRLRMDGALLDAAGQLAAYWLSEKFSWENTCFPFQVGHYTQYADPPPAGTPLLCRGDVRLKDGVRLEAQFDLVDQHGKLYARAADWGSRKFTIAANIRHFRADPLRRYLSQEWMPQALAQSGVVARLLEPYPEGYLDQGGGLWQRMIANMALGPEERKVFYRELPPSGPRREEWLMGRIAAKEAVRQWLLTQHGLHLAGADIELTNAASGEPYVAHIVGLPPGIGLPTVSISHSRRGAFAACTAGGARLGIDYQVLERVDVDALIAGGFIAAETQYLAGLDDAERRRAAVGLWGAKEAAAKAAGSGLGGRPSDWTIVGASVGPGHARQLASVRHAGHEYAVELHFTEGAVFALCLTPPAGDTVPQAAA